MTRKVPVKLVDDPARLLRALETIRQERHLSCRQLSERAGLSPTTIHDLVTGRRRLCLATLTRIMEALDAEFEGAPALAPQTSVVVTVPDPNHGWQPVTIAVSSALIVLVTLAGVIAQWLMLPQ